MAYPVIYFIILLIYGLWVMGLILKNKTITFLAALMMFPLAIHIFRTGIDIFAHDDFVSISFAAVTFALGAYTSLRVALETIEENY